MNLSYEAQLNSMGYSALNVGTALTNSTAATDISPGANTAGQAFTFPASYLQVGQQFKVRAKGIISNTGTPTLNLGLYLGGVAGTALAATGAIATVTTLSNNIWSLEADMRVESTGTNGSIRTLGAVTGPFAAAASLPASSSSGNLVSSLDTSTAKVLTLGGTWGAASASNSVQVILFVIERLNEGAS